MDIKIKKPCKSVLVRVPEWIEEGSKEVACTVNGESSEFSWEGRYVSVGAVEPGVKITVTFPVWERTVKEMIGGVLYTLAIKGNTVVFIDPPGKNCPFYQRDHYRQNKTLWVKFQAFGITEIHRGVAVILSLSIILKKRRRETSDVFVEFIFSHNKNSIMIGDCVLLWDSVFSISGHSMSEKSHII